MRVLGALLSQINSRRCFRRCRLVLLALLGLAAEPSVQAQFFVYATTGPTNAIVNAPVTFTLELTNVTGVQLLSVVVTNTFIGPASPQFVNATNSTPGTIFTNASGVIFDLGTMINGATARLSITLKATTAGLFTNSFEIASTYGTNISTTNLVVQVFPVTSDLAVSLTPPSLPLLAGDTTTYSVTVTNLGTNAAAGVTLTNSGFNVLKLTGLTPTNQSYTLTNGQLVFNLGTLSGRTGKNFLFDVQPTNAGPLNLFATIAATNIIESNAANNTAGTNITVGSLVTGNLLATNATPMTLNRQTGLMEQTVRLVNVSTNDVASARVIVSGLTNRLYNAAGTNNGNPYVVYSAALAASQSVDLLLEYFAPARVPFNVANSDYTAVATEAAIVSVTSVPGANITLVTNLGPAGILIEFEAITNRTYTIYYSSNASFTTPGMAQPSVVAPANRVQWIDNGPPKTSSHPTTESSRFYRVLLNP